METIDREAKLEQAIDLICDDKPKAALKLLNPLYKADEDNVDVIGAVLDALTDLDMHDKAKTVIMRAIKRQPKEVELWGRLVHFYLGLEDADTALKALAKADTVLPNHYELRRLQAFVYSEQGNREAMHDTLEGLMAAHPEHARDLLVERADLYRSLSMNPAADEAQVKDALGFMAFAVVPLQKAVADITRALELEPGDWHLYFKRAGLYKQLTEFDEAVADFNRALEHLDQAGEDYKEFIAEERDGCLNGGRNERESMANTLREGMASADDGDLSLDDYISNNLVDALADQHIEGGAMLEIMEAIDDDPDEAMALSIAQDIIKQAREPSADYQPVDGAEFPSAARGFCNKVEKQLAAEGFESLGDFEPVGLRQMLGKRALVRILLAEDKRTCAAAFRFSPLKPALWIWLILLVLRQWRNYNIVQLESATDDGRFVITNNAGSLNPFVDNGPNVDLVSLPNKVKLADILAAHQERAEPLAASLVQYDGLNGVLEYQEKSRLAKNAHRESIGYVTDAELKSLLAGQYEKFAEPVKKYMRLLTRKKS